MISLFLRIEILLSPYHQHLAQRYKADTQQILKGDRLLVSSSSAHYTTQGSLPSKIIGFYLDGSNGQGSRPHMAAHFPHPIVLLWALLRAAEMQSPCSVLPTGHQQHCSFESQELLLLEHGQSPISCLPSPSSLLSPKPNNLVPQGIRFPYPLFLAVVLLWTTSISHVPSNGKSFQVRSTWTQRPQYSTQRWQDFWPRTT